MAPARTFQPLAVLMAAGLLTLPSGRTEAAARAEVVYAGAGDARNHGQWGTIMPGGCAGRVRIDTAAPDPQPAPAAGALAGTAPEGAAGTVVRVDFDLPLPGWCGLVVLMQDGNWGAQPGPALAAAGASALVFRARGANGGEGVRIKAAIVPDQPFGDSAALPLDSGWITLTPEWRTYRIETTGRDLSRIVTPFVVIANDRHNPSGRLSVFFDDIRYEWDR